MPAWFHEGQASAWKSPSPIVAICAAWQSGKTVFLPWWLLREIQRRGPGDYGAFSSTYKLLQRKFLPELRQVFKPYAIEHKADMQFVFTTEGSRLLWGDDWDGSETVIQLGYAENPDSLESATMKAVVWDEPGQKSVPEQSYLTVKSRLMVHRGRMCLSSRPYVANWYKDLVVTASPEVSVTNFASWHNPVNPAQESEYFENLRKSLPSWRFDMLFKGIFTKPAGSIFDILDPVRHRVQKPVIDPSWGCSAGLDFGGINTAGVVYRKEQSGSRIERMIVTAEYWPKAQLQTKDHVKNLKSLSGNKLFHAWGGAHGEIGWRNDFTLNGLAVGEPRFSGAGSVENRIQAVYSALAQDRLIISEDCQQTWQQLETYSRKIDENGEVLDEIEDKAAFHLVDALGYAVISEMPYLLVEEEAPQEFKPYVTTQSIAEHLKRKYGSK